MKKLVSILSATLLATSPPATLAATSDTINLEGGYSPPIPSS